MWTFDSQVGQLLFYLLVGQLEAVTHRTNPPPLLGIFMADGVVRDIFLFILCFYIFLSSCLPRFLLGWPMWTAKRRRLIFILVV